MSKVALAASAMAVLSLSLPGCGGSAAAGPRKGKVYRGKASWYGGKWHGRPTASGEPYNQRALTAAHRFLPFGTIVRVTNLRNKKSIRVRINDRGPFVKGRIIDVSRRAARHLRMLQAGVVPVKIQVVRMPKRKRKHRRRRRR
jgi:rare lipoprotein A